MLIFKRKTPYEKEIDKWEKTYPDPLLREYNPQCMIDLANINFKHHKIDEYEKDKRCIEAMSHEWTIEHKEEELLKNEFKHHKIDELEYEKRLNDIKKNPWAKIRFNYDETNDPTNLQTEVIYNEYFIKKLQKMGYSGESEDDIVGSWLSQVFASNIDAGDLGFDGESDDDKPYVERKKVNNTFIVG